MLERSRAWIYVCALAALNIYLCHESFVTESTGHFHSMHGSWIALARLVGLDRLAPHWWPYWGGGAPLEYTYAPFVPTATAVIARLFHWSLPLAFHALTGAIYCMGPVLLYVAGWRLFGAPGYSFAAGLAYSLLSPSELIVPDGKFAWMSLFNARRMYLAFDWDDLPHMTALALLPVAAWLLGRALKTRRTLDYVRAGAVMAVMMLANMFGLVLVAWTAITVPLAIERRLHVWSVLRAALLVGAVYLVVSPWLPPSMLQTIRYDAVQDGEIDTTARALLAFGIVALTFGIVWMAASRWIAHWPLRWVLLYAAPALLIPVLGQYWGPHFLPQPGRYKFEMELALVMLLIFGLRPIIQRIPTDFRIVIAYALLLLAGRQVLSHRRYAQDLLRPVDVPSSIEYRGAKFVEANLPGQRVLMNGSLALWLNAFTDQPQMGGQSYSTALNWMQQVAAYTLFTGQNAGERDAEVSILWLKAFGAQAVEVPGTNSPDLWKSFANPRKFDGVLPVLWSEQDTTIYRVPQISASLAHVMRPDQVVRRRPLHGLDVDELRRFVAALDDRSSPPASFEWQGTSQAVIRGVLPADAIVSTQINYHRGWHASTKSGVCGLRPDGIGLMTIQPNCTGECQIELRFDGGLESKLTRAASVGVLVLLVVSGILRRHRRNNFAAMRVV